MARAASVAGRTTPRLVARSAGFRDNRLLQVLFGWVLLVWVVAAIAPFDRFDWLLENLLFFAAFGAFIATYRRFPFSNLSYVLITAFMTLHLAGSHYTYAQTPLGFWAQDAFGFERNHYDRLVHFSFGLLWFYPGREALMRLIPASSAWASAVALALISGIGGFYEVIEAAVALVVSPELGNAYLGTQGDIWDAQWDMLAQCLGGAIAWVATAAIEPRRKAGKASR